jgi:hypothetical protein
MKRLIRPSGQQLALTLERETQHELLPDQRAKLVSALADLLLEALGAAAPESSNEPGESHEH